MLSYRTEAITKYMRKQDYYSRYSKLQNIDTTLWSRCLNYPYFQCFALFDYLQYNSNSLFFFFQSNAKVKWKIYLERKDQSGKQNNGLNSACRVFFCFAMLQNLPNVSSASTHQAFSVKCLCCFYHKGMLLPSTKYALVKYKLLVLQL